LQDDKEHYAYCHDCQLKRGAIPPKENMICTVTSGKCPKCSEEKTLVPNMDYDWPDGTKAWFD